MRVKEERWRLGVLGAVAEEPRGFKATKRIDQVRKDEQFTLRCGFLKAVAA